MRKGPDKTDVLPGVLRADGDKAQYKCTVAMATKLTRGSASNAVHTSLTINSSGLVLADGMYHLDVRGRIFKVQRVGGRWPVLQI